MNKGILPDLLQHDSIDERQQFDPTRFDYVSALKPTYTEPFYEYETDTSETETERHDRLNEAASA